MELDGRTILKWKHALKMLAAFVAFGIVWSGWYIVPAGHRGVEFSQINGVKTSSNGEGFHFKMPLLETVTKYEVRSQLYTTDAEGASKDLQDVHTQVAVLFHPEPSLVWKVHQTLGPDYQNRVVKPSVQEAVKAVTATHLAADLIVNRSGAKAQITEAIEKSCDGCGRNHLTEGVGECDVPAIIGYIRELEAELANVHDWERKASEEAQRLASQYAMARTEALGLCPTCERPILEDAGPCSAIHANVIWYKAKKEAFEQAASMADEDKHFELAKQIRWLKSEGKT